jgi:hypothetical protein
VAGKERIWSFIERGWWNGLLLLKHTKSRLQLDDLVEKFALVQNGFGDKHKEEE